MSFRTYVNDVQIFGNNESYTEWDDFLKSQGIEKDADGNYDGYITDFIGALEAIEKIVLRLESVNQSHCWTSVFDLQATKRHIDNGEKLLDELFDLIACHYLFLPYNFYLACEDMLEKDETGWDGNRFHRFKLKPGCKIHVKYG